MSQICVTVTGRTMGELRRARDAASGADIVEVRLDGVDRPDAAGAIEGRLRPVIVTCRPRWEGGAFDGSETERRQIISQAIAAGAEFVDVELRSEFVADIVRMRRGRGVIASTHIYGAAPKDVAERVRCLRSTGAEVVKFATDVSSLTETLPLYELGAGTDARAEGQDHVLIAMGPHGTHTRVLSARLKNRWTYCGDGVAPGQIPAARMLSEFHFKRIRADTDLYAVVGSPIAHSLSPAMHNAGFAQAGLNAAYVALDARDAKDFVSFAHAMNLRGASITAPLKVSLMTEMDELEPLAKEVGAVNTLAVRGGRWIGANTDVAGFLAPLKGRMTLRGTRAAILGAGGAARAVAVALQREGADVRVCARRLDEATNVAALVGVRAGTFPPAAGSWDVLVNATSCGSRAGDSSVMAGARLDGEIVFDLVYAPGETPLLEQAQASGCWTIGGIDMLIAQAERQFEIWTGAAPPAGLFRAAIDSASGWQTGARA
jgi:3-dehydroquinate dehydratase / shikimate dehydrogenase